MTIGQNALGTPFTATHTAPKFALGTRMLGGESTEYVYVQASGAITGAGYVVTLDEAFQAVMSANAAAGALGDHVAVAPAAFADDAFGWVQIKGPCQIRVAASAAANVQLATTTTAGQIDDAVGTGTKNLNGIVLTTAREATAGLAPGILNYPVIGTTNA